MSMTEIIGAFSPDGNFVICNDCYRNLENNHPTHEVEQYTYQHTDSEAYPDGFTCDDCLTVVLPNNYEKGQNK